MDRLRMQEKTFIKMIWLKYTKKRKIRGEKIDDIFYKLKFKFLCNKEKKQPKSHKFKLKRRQNKKLLKTKSKRLKRLLIYLTLIDLEP